VVHHPGGSLVNDAAGQVASPGEEIASKASDHVHARQDQRLPESGQEHFRINCCGHPLYGASGIPATTPRRRDGSRHGGLTWRTGTCPRKPARRRAAPPEALPRSRATTAHRRDGTSRAPAKPCPPSSNSAAAASWGIVPCRNLSPAPPGVGSAEGGCRWGRGRRRHGRRRAGRRALEGSLPRRHAATRRSCPSRQPG